MTFESVSDIECVKHAGSFCRDNLIQQCINDGLFVHSPISFNNSEVEYTFTFDCDFRALSSDHIGQFSFKANAKYSTSFESGEISSASFKKSLNSSFSKNLILGVS